MAIKILGFMNKVINRTASEVLDGQLIDKSTHVLSTFLTSGVEAIKDLTQENQEGQEETNMQ